MAHVLKSARLALLAGLAVGFGGAGLAQAEEAMGEKEKLVKEAKQAIQGLMGDLQKQLKAALKEGGPTKAIEVCKDVAPAIAEKQSQAHGMTVARTALKFRNPDNAPDDYEKQVMEKFLEEIAAGKSAKELASAEIVEGEDGSRTFRFMKAIPTAEKPCLACHGSNIDPAVKAKIDAAYPNDQAVGFKAGDMRGAFTIQKKL